MQMFISLRGEHAIELDPAIIYHIISIVAIPPPTKKTRLIDFYDQDSSNFNYAN